MTSVRQKGFSFIEVILVIGLFAFIVAFGSVISLNSVARSSVIQERDLFVTLLLRGARAEALANVGETDHGIKIDNDTHEYILFYGNDYDSGAPENRLIPFTNNNITITTDSGEDEIVFEALSGSVNEGAGTLTLSLGAATQEIIINEVGQIDW
jgi:prepilin-type N-terminal cleavage/methylation domain-containing protein